MYAMPRIKSEDSNRVSGCITAVKMTFQESEPAIFYLRRCGKSRVYVCKQQRLITTLAPDLNLAKASVFITSVGALSRSSIRTRLPSLTAVVGTPACHWKRPRLGVGGVKSEEHFCICLFVQGARSPSRRLFRAPAPHAPPARSCQTLRIHRTR